MKSYQKRSECVNQISSRSDIISKRSLLNYNMWKSLKMFIKLNSKFKVADFLLDLGHGSKRVFSKS